MRANIRGFMEKFDFVVVGGGAGGIACAWNAAKNGLKTLLIEKNIHLGGLITSGLVIPVMKLNSLDINVEFYNELISVAKSQNACVTYEDGNSGWFNPELMKSVFDEMLSSVGCKVLFNTEIFQVEEKNDKFFLNANSEVLSLHIETNYLVDGTGNGKIFEKLNLEFLKDIEEKQSLSLRFMMSNVDNKKFSDWIMNFDKNRNVTTACKVDGQVHFSTACTWDKSGNWALAPIFEQAVTDGVLKPSDSAYFQIFSVPYADGCVAFNCPKLLPKEGKNPPAEPIYAISELLIEGRKRINRIADFCRKYLKGFENAYVSNISDMLGVRESRRVKGKKVFTVSDISTGKKPENIALASDYPIDVHSDKKGQGELTFTKHVWYLPLEALISEKYDNLFVVGRCLSAEFKAQAAVRTQMNCFSMGEAVAKHILTTKKAPETQVLQ